MRRFIGLLILPMALLLIVPVHAATLSVLTGNLFSGQATSSSIEHTSADNVFGTITAPASFTGGIEGSGVLTENVIVHNSTGLIIAHGQIVFSGTVGGSQVGTALVRFDARATVAPETSFGGAKLLSFDGLLVLGDGTGGLTGLHGEGTVGIVNGHLGYSVQVHFDPA